MVAGKKNQFDKINKMYTKRYGLTKAALQIERVTSNDQYAVHREDPFLRRADSRRHIHAYEPWFSAVYLQQPGATFGWRKENRGS